MSRSWDTSDRKKMPARNEKLRTCSLLVDSLSRGKLASVRRMWVNQKDKHRPNGVGPLDVALVQSPAEICMIKSIPAPAVHTPPAMCGASAAPTCQTCPALARAPSDAASSRLPALPTRNLLHSRPYRGLNTATGLIYCLSSYAYPP